MSHPHFCSRRHFARASAFGLGGLALASLLREEGLLAAPVVSMVPDPLARLDVLFVAVGFAAVGIQANNRHLPLR